jgi:Skp family chaperone for outer membrane proteins
MLIQIMADKKRLKVGTVNLNQLCRALNEFADMRGRLEQYRNEREQEMRIREETLRQTPSAEHGAHLNQFNAWRKTHANETHQFAVRERNQLLEKIKEVIRQIALDKAIDLVIDTGEVSTIGFPVVLFAHEELDMTNEIVCIMNGGDSAAH